MVVLSPKCLLSQFVVICWSDTYVFFSFLSSLGFLLVSRFLVFHGDSLTKMFLIICSIPWGRRLVDWLVQEACKIYSLVPLPRERMVELTTGVSSTSLWEYVSSSSYSFC